jgi:hypothetical protein
MFDHFQQQGRAAAFSAFGLEKTAINWGSVGAAVKPHLQEIGQAMKPDWSTLPGRLREAVTPDFKSWPGRMKNFLVGSPTQYWHQLKNNQLFNEGGMYRDMFKMPDFKKSPIGGTLSTALNYGLPALSIYQASQLPPEMRGSAVGGTLGGIIGGFAGAPLGAIGQLGGSMLAGGLGQSLGSAFDDKSQRRSWSPYMVAQQQDQPALSDRMSAVTGRPTRL